MGRFLVKATIPAVQELIVQSRKLVDLYGGSTLIPQLISTSLKSIKNQKMKLLIPSEAALDTDNITNVVYLIFEGSRDEVKAFGMELKDRVKRSLEEILYEKIFHKDERLTNWKDLALYQIQNSIKLVWSAVEIQDGDIHKAKEEVDRAVAYLKATFIPEDSVIESYTLVIKGENLFFEDNFESFIENQGSLKDSDGNSYPNLIGASICSICGKRTIVGATGREPTGKTFWNSYWKNKESEKLCGFCLAKRLFSKKKFESVVDFAIADHPEESKIRETLKGLDIQLAYEENWKDVDSEVAERLRGIYRNSGKPSKYYGLIMADGDGMGEKVEKAFQNNKVEEFTTQLSSYSPMFRDIVQKNKGDVIYSGGDDILAILPKSTTLDAYIKISSSFKISTMSGGIVFTHYKVPLSYVLQRLRENEKLAKDKGKDGVYISYIKHSLSSSGCFVKNPHLEYFNSLLEIMGDDDFPNTFVYQLEALLRPYGRETAKVEEVKTVIDYLVNKKKFSKRDTFKELIFQTPLMIDENKGVVDIEDMVGKLKVANFLAGGSNAKD